MMTLEKLQRLDRMNSHAIKYGLGSELNKCKGTLKAVYDFSNPLQGGAVGDVSLYDIDGGLAKLPAGAIVTECFAHVVTAATSGGAATVGLTSEGTADLVAATAVASLTLNALIDGVPADTAATYVRMTAERTLKATIATAALTAGKVHFFVDYVLSTQ